MQLIERYLQAVRFWLPKAQRDDILAEIAEDLRSQVEEREQMLGHSLEPAEVSEILKRRGHPLLVAGSFLPQSGPMDPVLWTIYRFILKVVLLWILTPILIVAMLPGVIQAHDHAAAYLAAIAGICQSMVFAVGMITIVFALVRKYGVQRVTQLDWDPQRLPAVHDAQEIPRFGSSFSLIWGIFFLLWWVDLVHFPVLLHGAAVRIEMSPVPVVLNACIVSVWIWALGMHAVNLWRPWWTRARAWIWLALNCATAAVAAWMAQAGPWVIVTAVSPSDTAGVASLGRVINSAVTGTLWVAAGILVAIILLQDVRRALRGGTSQPPVGFSAAMKTIQ